MSNFSDESGPGDGELGSGDYFAFAFRDPSSKAMAWAAWLGIQARKVHLGKISKSILSPPFWLYKLTLFECEAFAAKEEGLGWVSGKIKT